MLDRVRYFFSDIGHWLRTHLALAGLIGVALVAVVAVAVLLATRDDGSSTASEPAPAPKVVVRPTQAPAPADTEDLGFPTFATKNTTRVAGADPIADAAAVALAVHPSTGDSPAPPAVTLVDAGDWQGAIAASVLAGPPVGAPLLVTDGGELPPLSATALRALDPKGSSETAGRQVFVIGGAATPDGFRALNVGGSDPAAVANGVDQLRDRLAGDPDAILVVSSDAPEYSMPAAAWAARSGDPVLFTGKNSVPTATIEALRRHDGIPVYALGPESAISTGALKQLQHVAPTTQRVGKDGAVENAIAFARYTGSGGFGWNINDPGHGFVIANANRPLDAAVASPLSASGTWGPLL